VLEFRCGWVGVVSVLQAEVCNTDTTPPLLFFNYHNDARSNTHKISKLLEQQQATRCITSAETLNNIGALLEAPPLRKT